MGLAFKLWQAYFAIFQLKVESNFQNDLGLDSLDHVEIIMAVEDDFRKSCNVIWRRCDITDVARSTV